MDDEHFLPKAKQISYDSSCFFATIFPDISPSTRLITRSWQQSSSVSSQKSYFIVVVEDFPTLLIDSKIGEILKSSNVRSYDNI